MDEHERRVEKIRSVIYGIIGVFAFIFKWMYRIIDYIIVSLFQEHEMTNITYGRGLRDKYGRKL